MRFILAVAVGLLTCLDQQVALAFDIATIDRKISKQPPFIAAQPLYALVVLGPKADQRVWMILDKSTAEGEQYDVVYVDLNSNGDLTEASEKFSATDSKHGGASFTLPDLQDAASGEMHTEFSLGISRRAQETHMVSLLWRGGNKIGGGYPADPAGGYMSFAASADKAPIVWFNGDGPFRFQRWFSEEFTIGESDDLKLFLGQRGVGNSSFGAFQRHVLPEKEPVLATLIYTDTDGKQRTANSKLMERC